MIRQFCVRLNATKNAFFNAARISTESVSKHNSTINGKMFLYGNNSKHLSDDNGRHHSAMFKSFINLIQGKIPSCPHHPTNFEIPLTTKLPFSDPIKSTILPLDILDPNKKSSITEPEPEKVIEKQAARLLVIRKRKMKKHQLRKLRKRMLIKWAHRRLLREQRKEKVFQAELLAQVKEAEMFDAEKWVENFIERSNHYAKLKEEEAFYQTDEGYFLKLKLLKEQKRIKPADWKD